MKKANGGLPNSLWDTYSSFANCYFMQPDVWYKASDLMDVLGLKETRTKELLRALLADEKLVDDGATKGKRYKKAD